ncbi:response regulator [Rhizosphaericola mali]|uniref:Response regulator transcription factor n=1 Tax=Rhizosphaericola mali TaxID=2545455 RepID=A0A5P2G2W3_9BACT|nr:response regulator transcription factor [Rhizosphaericola mali]QES88140.1 response regulator transcription factor [Rhizosphaericola mali]
MTSNILIADDHFPVRIGLDILVNEILQSNPNIEFASNGYEILTKMENQNFDLLITDINMPMTDGFELIKQIVDKYPQTKILVVSVNPAEIFAPRLREIGICDYISKSESDEELKKAILNIVSGVSSNADKIETTEMEENLFIQLSSREFEVMIYLLKGLGNLEICNKLNITKTTASTYKNRIFSKLNVTSLMELSHLARKYHIVDDDLLLY